MEAKNKEEIFTIITDVLAEEFECPREKLTPDARIFEDLDIDSIDVVDLIVRLQKMADIRVKPDDFKEVRTLDDVAELISKAVAAK